MLAAIVATSVSGNGGTAGLARGVGDGVGVLLLSERGLSAGSFSFGMAFAGIPAEALEAGCDAVRDAAFGFGMDFAGNAETPRDFSATGGMSVSSAAAAAAVPPAEAPGTGCGCTPAKALEAPL